MAGKIAISINTAWNIYNFRRSLIKALIDRGYEVVAIAPSDEYVERIRGLGCRFIGIQMDNNGTNPGKDLRLLAQYLKVLRAEKPMTFLSYTVKPNVYGSMAAHLLNIPVVNNIAGLGAALMREGILARIVRTLYKHSLKRSYRIFFQNEDDRQLFLSMRLVEAAQTDRLPGSGMDLMHYRPVLKIENPEQAFSFLVVARMLRDKGIEEFVAAARLVRKQFPNTVFQLLGGVDPLNPNSIPLSRIRSWEEEGLISYLGKNDDVRPYLSAANCAVLPSYREGVSRSLLEAAAMERPIITTHTAGCRDVVEHGINGFLCNVMDGPDLARKMVDMLRLSSQQRREMGRAGRQKVVSEFDESIVIQKYLDVIKDIEMRAAVCREPGSTGFGMSKEYGE